MVCFRFSFALALFDPDRITMVAMATGRGKRTYYSRQQELSPMERRRWQYLVMAGVTGRGDVVIIYARLYVFTSENAFRYLVSYKTEPHFIRPRNMIRLGPPTIENFVMPTHSSPH